MLRHWYFELQKLKGNGLVKGKQKGYSMRMPYYEIFNHFEREFEEFRKEYLSGNMTNALNELADISNMCDLFFEQIYVALKSNLFKEINDLITITNEKELIKRMVKYIHLGWYFYCEKHNKMTDPYACNKCNDYKV